MKELLTARGYKYSQKVDRPLRARDGGREGVGVGRGNEVGWVGGR